MNVPGLLPDGGVPLPRKYYDLPPLDPKHKAVVLYFYYMTAYEAAALTTNDDDEDALSHCSQFAISVFMQKVYNVRIHPDSIQEYCSQARANAEKAGLRWDQSAVAEIISSQVRDQDTFDEITSFLNKIERRFSLSAHFFRDHAYKATHAHPRDSTAYIKFESFWDGAMSSESCGPPRILDPVLRQSSNIEPETSTNYGSLWKLENRLAKGKPFAYRFPKAKSFNLDD